MLIISILLTSSNVRTTKMTTPMISPTMTTQTSTQTQMTTEKRSAPDNTSTETQTISPAPSPAKRPATSGNYTFAQIANNLNNYFDPQCHLRPVNLLTTGGPRITIKSVANHNFQLISVKDSDGSLGFSYPVMQKLESDDVVFKQQTRIIAIVPKRRSKNDNTAISKPGSTYKSVFYLAALERDDIAHKKRALDAILQVGSFRN